MSDSVFRHSGPIDTYANKSNRSTEGADPEQSSIDFFGEIYGKDNKAKTLEFKADDAAGKLLTVEGEHGQTIEVATNNKNELVIENQTYREVDDDKLTFKIENNELQVLRDGRALEGYTPLKLQENTFLNRRLDNVSLNAKGGSIEGLSNEFVGSITATTAHTTAPAAYLDIAPRDEGDEGGEGGEHNGFDKFDKFDKLDIRGEGGEGGEGGAIPSAVGMGNSNNVISAPTSFSEARMDFGDYLSKTLEENAFGLEKQKFQFGGYDSSTVTTVNTWADVLKSGAVTENSDGSVTLTTSSDMPRVQFYPDTNVEGGRKTTKTEDLRDVSFDFAIENWKEGDAAWIYELHKVGDGQAMALGFDQQGNLMLANGNTNDTNISMTEPSRIAIAYDKGDAKVSVFNLDGSLRGESAIAVSGSEVHVKGIELYNRRAAADTEVSVRFGGITFDKS